MTTQSTTAKNAILPQSACERQLHHSTEQGLIYHTMGEIDSILLNAFCRVQMNVVLLLFAFVPAVIMAGHYFQ